MIFMVTCRFSYASRDTISLDTMPVPISRILDLTGVNIAADSSPRARILDNIDGFISGSSRTFADSVSEDSRNWVTFNSMNGSIPVGSFRGSICLYWRLVFFRQQERSRIAACRVWRASRKCPICSLTRDNIWRVNPIAASIASCASTCKTRWTPMSKRSTPATNTAKFV